MRYARRAYEEKFSNPFIAARKGYVDEVLLPEETTARLTETFRFLADKYEEETSPAIRKHGNMPL